MNGVKINSFFLHYFDRHRVTLYRYNMQVIHIKLQKERSHIIFQLIRFVLAMIFPLELNINHERASKLHYI